MPRVPRHTFRRPIESIYIQKVIACYKHLKNTNIDDFASWILDAERHKNDKNWRLAIFSLGMDVSARDYYVHLAYVRCLSNRFPHHDFSKTKLLELVLNSIIVHSPSDASWAKIPHILENDHHPEHYRYNFLLPNFLARLHSSNDFEDIYFELCNSLTLLINDNSYNQKTFVNYDEYAVDLIARRWQKVSLLKGLYEEYNSNPYIVTL